MRPYYEHGGITIYHGDCRAILPHVRADVIIADPPYGCGRHVDHKTRGEGVMLTGRHVWDSWDKFDLGWLRLVEGKPLAVFSSHGNLTSLICALGPTSKVVYWRKTNPQPITPHTEPCAVRDFSLSAGSEWVGLNAKALPHPAMKPIGLMQWIVAASPRGMLVDPFAGSGSTLVAAKALHRDAIGIEMDERYCAIAAERCSQDILDFGDVA